MHTATNPTYERHSLSHSAPSPPSASTAVRPRCPHPNPSSASSTVAGAAWNRVTTLYWSSFQPTSANTSPPQAAPTRLFATHHTYSAGPGPPVPEAYDHSVRLSENRVREADASAAAALAASPEARNHPGGAGQTLTVAESAATARRQPPASVAANTTASPA